MRLPAWRREPRALGAGTASGLAPRCTALLAMTLALASPLSAGREAASEERLAVTIAGDKSTTADVAVASAICRSVAQSGGAACAVRPQAGPRAVVAALRSGEATLALLAADLQAAAMAGRGDFAGDGPFAQLRSVVGLYVETMVVMARAETVRSPDELRGLRIAVGPAGGSAHRFAAALAQGFGWTDPASQLLVSPEAAGPARWLCSGGADGIVAAVLHPSQDIAAAVWCAGRILALRGTVAHRLVAGATTERSPYVAATVPSRLYRQRDDASSVGLPTALVASDAAPAATVTKVIAAIGADLDALRLVHPALAQLDRRILGQVGMIAPRHEGVSAAPPDADRAGAEPSAPAAHRPGWAR
ncbi:MAG: TAXI family TRAP transporter solute-binding subunit [Alphaproteobacteria bacterium]|nr:TAXI family TRAP transporter solute-binding subunit [Alphaproteobacteria bacterium]